MVKNSNIIAFMLKEKNRWLHLSINDTTYSHYFLGNLGQEIVPTLLHPGKF